MSAGSRTIAVRALLLQSRLVATITIASHGTLGDHFPFFALGEALAKKGHKIRYLGPPHLAESITHCGMEAWPFRCEVNPDKVRANPGSYDHWSPERGGSGTRPVAESSDLFTRGHYAEKLENMLAAAEESDFLLCSRLLPIGRTVSELSGIPWATACVVPWFYPSADTAAEKGIAAREDAENLRPVMRSFAERLNGWRKSRGLDALAITRARDWFEAPRILLATSPLFGVPAPEPGREIIQTGFWMFTPRDWRERGLSREMLDWLDSCDEPPMVLSFSSQPVRDPGALLDIHLNAARLLGRRLVVQGGWAEWNSPEFSRACAEGSAMRLPAGPQDELFRRAGAVIHHGGIGTTARAILAGTPQLVEPHGNDQFYNARQVIALGAGAAVNPHRLNADGLASVLRREGLTGQKKATVRQLAEKLASEPGVENAVRRLERWLEEA